MKFNEIIDYCNEKGLRVCLENLDICPFRELYKDTSFCKVVDFLVDYYLNSRYHESINHYLTDACSHIRQEILEDKKVCEDAKKRKERILNFAEIGDTVFCIPECTDVILLEKNVGINKMCRYRNVDGLERLILPYYLCVISKGRNFSTLITEQSDEMLEFGARELGFRVEREDSKNKVIYKFYGDSQQEVDDFVNNYCKNQNSRKKENEKKI